MRKWQRLIGSFLAALCLAAVSVPAYAQNSGGPNYMNQAILYGVGMPDVVINGSGSNFGQIMNPSGSRSTGVFALGYGTTSSTNGTEVVSWNTSGQVEVNHANLGSGASNSIAAASASTLSATPLSLLQVNSIANANGDVYYYMSYRSTGWIELKAGARVLPTLSTCGTSPSIASGVDEAGDFTFGTPPAGQGSCVITFASQPTNTPHCFCNDATTSGVICQVYSESTSGFSIRALDLAFQPADKVDFFCLGHG